MDLHPYAQAFADRDHTRTKELFTDDVIFHSPVIGDAAFEGLEPTAALFEVIYRELSDVEFTHEFGDDQARVLIANARVRGKQVKVSTLLELAPDGKIREIWVFARPLVGLVAIAEGIGAGLAQREMPSRARALELAMKPLAGLAATTDRIGARLVASVNRSAGQK